MRQTPLDRVDIERLVPQKGAMSLLDAVVSVSAETIVCRAVSHLDPANPLRRDGRLGMLCGCEYGMQAAALHGALVSGGTLPSGRIAALTVTAIAAARLDDPAHGVLTVTARRLAGDSRGLLYDFRLTTEDGRDLLGGGGTVALLAAPDIPRDGEKA